MSSAKKVVQLLLFCAHAALSCHIFEWRRPCASGRPNDTLERPIVCARFGCLLLFFLLLCTKQRDAPLSQRREPQVAASLGENGGQR